MGVSSFHEYLKHVTTENEKSQDVVTYTMTQIATYNRELTVTYTDERFRQDVEAYLNHLKDTGRRPATIETYSRALRSVGNTERTKFGELLDPRQMVPDDFIHLREAMTVCDNSKKLYLIVVGRLCKFLTGRNPRMDANILWNKTGKRRLFISPEQFKVMILDSSDEERLILTLGAYMGLRRCEIADIRLSDMKKGHLTVRGKGHGPQGKVEHLFMPHKVVDAIQRYMFVRENIVAATGSTDDHLLLRQKGTHAGEGMDSRVIGDIVERISKRNGVDMTPHSLRRLYATTMYEGGVDLNTIRIMMRHESIDTTLGCYINVSNVRMDTARVAVEQALS